MGRFANASVEVGIPMTIAPSLLDQRPARAAEADGTAGAAHVPALDALRGLAILLVLVFHLKPSLEPSSPLQFWFYRGLQAGWCGVDLFFVLSGFLITGILWDAKGSPAYFRTFYARRILRIFPLYYGVLALVFLAYPLYDAAPSDAYREISGRQGWLWAYASNIQMSLTGTFDFWAGNWHFNHFWSLAVEEHFYLVWPFVVFLLGRRQLMAVCLACVATAFVWRGVLTNGHHSFLCAYTFTPCRMDALAIGAYLALAARGPTGLSGLRRPALLLSRLTGAGLLVLFIGLRGLKIEDPWMQTGGYTLLAIFFAALLVLAVTAPRGSLLGRLGRRRFLRFFGKYSYGLYVWHGVALLLLQQLPTADLVESLGWPLPAVVLHTGLSIGITVAMALLSWHLWEKQFLRLKRFFEYRRSSPHPQPLPPKGRGETSECVVQ
jgi:peptidoglycan/LPS O-acetylase OafA/YrhL